MSKRHEPQQVATAVSQSAKLTRATGRSPGRLPDARRRGHPPAKPTAGFIAKRAERRKKRRELEEKQDAALKMYLEQESWSEIAREVGFSHASNARRAVHAAVRRRYEAGQYGHERSLAEMRLMLAQNARLIESWFPRARDNNDLDALRAVEILHNRRAKMLRLDAPEQVEVSGKGGGPIQVEHLEQVEHIREAVFELIEQHPEMGPEIAQRFLAGDGDLAAALVPTEAATATAE